MVEKPIDVIVKIDEYRKQGQCFVHAKISECMICCEVGSNTYTHKLRGIDFNKLIYAFTLLDVEFKVS